MYMRVSLSFGRGGVAADEPASRACWLTCDVAVLTIIDTFGLDLDLFHFLHSSDKFVVVMAEFVLLRTENLRI